MFLLWLLTGGKTYTHYDFLYHGITDLSTQQIVPAVGLEKVPVC